MAAIDGSQIIEGPFPAGSDPAVQVALSTTTTMLTPTANGLVNATISGELVRVNGLRIGFGGTKHVYLPLPTIDDNASSAVQPIPIATQAACSKLPKACHPVTMEVAADLGATWSAPARQALTLNCSGAATCPASSSASDGGTKPGQGGTCAGYCEWEATRAQLCGAEYGADHKADCPGMCELLRKNAPQCDAELQAYAACLLAAARGATSCPKGPCRAEQAAADTCLASKWPWCTSDTQCATSAPNFPTCASVCTCAFPCAPGDPAACPGGGKCYARPSGVLTTGGVGGCCSTVPISTTGPSGCQCAYAPIQAANPQEACGNVEHGCKGRGEQCCPVGTKYEALGKCYDGADADPQAICAEIGMCPGNVICW